MLNWGAAAPPASSPSQALRASSPKGRAFSRRQTFRYIQNLSLWERWHREAMTERARPTEAAQSLGLDCAFDGAVLPQGSAKPSAQLLVSVLALSGASRQLPQRGSFFEKENFPVHPKPLTLGEVASRSDDGEGKPASGETSPQFSLSLRWAKTHKKTGQHRFRAAGWVRRRGMPRSVCINIWPGCWTGTS